MTTLVQIRRSTTNTAPSSLQEGELGYSYVSNTLFIGDTANGIMNIAGKYYTNIIDAANTSNSASTLVKRFANGFVQLNQIDIITSPTVNSHVTTKLYVDSAIASNAALANLVDVNIGTLFSNQNNRVLVGNSAGYYVGVDITGNVTISNTGIVTINAGNVTNEMLLNNTVTVVAGAGLANGGNVSLGGTITLDVVAGDGISNSNNDTISVDNTVVRTDRNQTLNGFYTFSNTTTFNSDVGITGNLTLSGNTTLINVATLNITDPLIFLAANNILSDLVDIGFVGSKNTAGIFSYTGLARHAADGEWYLFDNETDDINDNIIDVANTTYALLHANIYAQQLNVSSGFANVDTTLAVTGNTSLLSNLTVSKNTTVQQNLFVSEFSRANTFVSTKLALTPPSLSNFNGERLRLYDFNEAGRPNYAIGVEGNHIWMGVDSSANNQGFKWYGNTAQSMRLSGNGVLEVANTISTVNVFTTNLNVNSLLAVANLSVTQNANVAGTLNVASATWLSSLTLGTALGSGSGGTGLTSFTANGVAFADTTSTLSFATGTEGELLQIKSGIPSFDMLDGGSF